MDWTEKNYRQRSLSAYGLIYEVPWIHYIAMRLYIFYGIVYLNAVSEKSV